MENKLTGSVDVGLSLLKFTKSNRTEVTDPEQLYSVGQRLFSFVAATIVVYKTYAFSLYDTEQVQMVAIVFTGELSKFGFPYLWYWCRLIGGAELHALEVLLLLYTLHYKIRIYYSYRLGYTYEMHMLITYDHKLYVKLTYHEHNSRC